MTQELRLIIAGLITLGVVAFFSGLIWLMLELRPVDHNSTQIISYPLAKGTSAPAVSEQLEQKGIIRNHSAFSLYVTLRGLRSKLQAGTYELSPSNSSIEVASIIAGGRIAANRLIIPDGASILDIRKIADQRGVPMAELDAALKATYPNDYIAAKPAGTTLEGYLYPDSYEVMKPVRTQALVQIMLDNFANKIAQTDVVQRFAAQGMTLHQGVTLASIVEKEVSNDQDRAMVAQVYLNRLKIGMPLQADPTVLYIADATGTKFDINSTSPYNTYNHKGLPPGPICNPSLSSMKAVAHPQANEYLYFLADKQGKTHYAKTFAEHQKNVDTYLK